MTDETNRRAYLRFPIDALVWWNQDWEPEPITLIDISAGGMLAEFPKAMPKGDQVTLHFEFPGMGRLIQCICEVAHCREGAGNLYQVGLHVTEVEGMSHDAFVARLKNGLPA